MRREKIRVLILGAAGRDFHNFNVCFRDNPRYEVVAFTAGQLPNIANRIYPPELAGSLYPDGIPIYPESEMTELIRKLDIDLVVLSYSDLLYSEVMRLASKAMAEGASFMLVGPKDTMLECSKPVISVCAVRTGAGKSTVTRRVCDILVKRGLKPVVVRHPMPYGDLSKQVCMKFETYKDLDRYECTIEEREEFEPHIERGYTVFAGVDYEVVLREAEKHGDIIVWDGGNNDLPFFKPDLHIVVVDPLRPGHELSSYPGEINLRMADVVVVNKVVSANPKDLMTVRENVRRANPNAVLIEAASPPKVENPSLIRGKKVLVVEDGPTVTHGGLPYSIGYIAAIRYGAAEIVDPRPYAIGSIREAFEKYTHMSNVLPALGYGKSQLAEFIETIKRVPCDTVVSGTPIDLARLVKLDKPIVRVRYELQEIGEPTLEDVIADFLRKMHHG
ncbi:MAG: GTPase [Thermoproteota archaeon]|nr:MAG: GTPase [Candidatus Korarchaeota archaeon]